MNFKKIILLLISSMLFSCGVKAPPLKHPEIEIDSYIETISGTDQEKTEAEQKKKN